MPIYKSSKKLLQPWRHRGAGPRIPTPFDFDAGAVAFTPGMDKRGTGLVFAGAPMVQGHWDGSGTPDKIAAYEGADMLPFGRWKERYDPYQGGGFVIWTPEQSSADRTDTNDAIIWRVNDGNNLRYEYDTNQYRLRALNQAVVVPATITAGVPEILAWGYQQTPTLDGTNYAYFSRNDVQSFGVTSRVVTTPDTMSFGSGAGDAPSSGLIEGLTFVREVPWTGSYGTDMGVGDVVEDHYAAGAGADACLTIGSWGVTFCMPTNATPGALVTGTGEAWSHPHSSALLEHSWLEDGGYLGGPYGVLYNGTTTSAVVSDGAAIQDLADNAFTAEAWVRADSNGQNDVGRIFDKTGSAGAGWRLNVRSGEGIQGVVLCATTAADSRTGTDDFLADGKWHHITMFFDDAGDRKIYLAVDGVWAADYGTQDAGVGAIVTDVGDDLYIGNRSNSDATFDGCIGWSRISDNDRYSHTTDFVPARTPPASDGNTVVLYHFDEGTGATADNEEGTAAFDATLSNHTWEEQWNIEGTPVVPYSVAYNGTTTSGVVTDGVAIQDLADNAFTAEAWIRPDGVGEADNPQILHKTPGGWQFALNVTIGLWGLIDCATTDAYSIIGMDDLSFDGRWHHVTMFFDDAGDRKIYLAVDGVWVSSYVTQDAGVGAIVTDVGSDLYIGNRSANDRTFDGAIGYVQISDSDRYSHSSGDAFVVPSRLNPPASDGNTVVQYLFREGAGATLDNAEGTAAFDATVSNHSWNTTPDMHVDCPGQKVYGNWGYVLGMDAANEGITQIETGLAAGANRVVRVPLQYERDRQFWPEIQVYDETNSAAIVQFLGPRLQDVHTGGAASATLVNANGEFPQSLDGGTVYNITDGSSGTITAISGDKTTITAALSGGTDDLWDNGDDYMIVPPNEDSWVWCEPFTYELPTIARNGAAADCDSVSTKVLNANSEGAIYAQQVEVQANFVDNPSLETGAGNPWIPSGWINYNLDPGDTQASSTGGNIVHSGSDALQVNVGAAIGEHTSDSAAGFLNRFFMLGCWCYGDGTKKIDVRDRWDVSFIQQDGTGRSPGGASVEAVWSHARSVFRGQAATISYREHNPTGVVGTRYLDDVYIVRADDVSLTVTPASEANSAETSGLRVDGHDSCTQLAAATILGPTMGRIRWGWTPRHSDTEAVTFDSPAYIMKVDGGANNYIDVVWNAADNLRMLFNANGAGVQTGNWATGGGAIVPGTTYQMEVRYWPGRMRLYIDEVNRIEINAATGFVWAFPVPVYWGSTDTIISHVDSTFSAPT